MVHSVGATTGDEHQLPGDPGRSIGAEEQHRPGDVVGRSDPAERDGGGDRLVLSVGAEPKEGWIKIAPISYSIRWKPLRVMVSTNRILLPMR